MFPERFSNAASINIHSLQSLNWVKIQLRIMASRVAETKFSFLNIGEATTVSNKVIKNKLSKSHTVKWNALHIVVNQLNVFW